MNTAPEIKLGANDFEVFGLPPRFALEPQDLDARWKALQRQVHPDQLAASGAAAQRVAAQWSARINEAHRRLKDPIARAALLCELRGAPVNANTNTAMPAAFLMEQMSWREALEEAKTEADLNALTAQTAAFSDAKHKALASFFDAAEPQSESAAQVVRMLMFVKKFQHDVDAAFDRLGA